MPLPEGWLGIVEIGVACLGTAWVVIFASRLLYAPIHFWVLAEAEAHSILLKRKSLRLIFDSTNLTGKFWSDEYTVETDEDGESYATQGLQYRVAVYNDGYDTVCDVHGILDRTDGDDVVLKFYRTNSLECDIHPGATEYLNVYFFVESRHEMVGCDIESVTLRVRARDTQESRMCLSLDPRFTVTYCTMSKACGFYRSSNRTPSNSNAARVASKNVAAIVPRLSLLAIDASVSFNPCSSRRLASSA